MDSLRNLLQIIDENSQFKEQMKPVEPDYEFMGNPPGDPTYKTDPKTGNLIPDIDPALRPNAPRGPIPGTKPQTGTTPPPPAGSAGKPPAPRPNAPTVPSKPKPPTTQDRMPSVPPAGQGLKKVTEKTLEETVDKIVKLIQVNDRLVRENDQGVSKPPGSIEGPLNFVKSKYGDNSYDAKVKRGGYIVGGLWFERSDSLWHGSLSTSPTEPIERFSDKDENKVADQMQIFWNNRNIKIGLGIKEQGVAEGSIDDLANQINNNTQQLLKIDREIMTAIAKIFQSGIELTPAQEAQLSQILDNLADVRNNLQGRDVTEGSAQSPQEQMGQKMQDQMGQEMQYIINRIKERMRAADQQYTIPRKPETAEDLRVRIDNIKQRIEQAKQQLDPNAQYSDDNRVYQDYYRKPMDTLRDSQAELADIQARLEKMSGSQ